MESDEFVSKADAYEAEKQQRIFVLGLILLFGWVAVVALCCAYPQLLRNFVFRYLCCLLEAHRRNRSFAEEVSRAKERMRSASRSFISVSMAANPSAILLEQAGFCDDLAKFNAEKQQKQYGGMAILIPEPISENVDEMENISNEGECIQIQNEKIDRFER